MKIYEISFLSIIYFTYHYFLYFYKYIFYITTYPINNMANVLLDNIGSRQ